MVVAVKRAIMSSCPAEFARNWCSGVHRARFIIFIVHRYPSRAHGRIGDIHTEDVGHAEVGSR